MEILNCLQQREIQEYIWCFDIVTDIVYKAVVPDPQTLITRLPDNGKCNVFIN